MATTATWQSRASAKRASQLALIPADLRISPPSAADRPNVLDWDFSQHLTERELAITQVESVGALLDKLAQGEWSAVEVLTAFSKRALVAHQLVNCLTEIFIDEGLKRAQELDKHFKKTGKTVGPLHGLPISLKDQVDIAGQTMSMGYVGWLDSVSATTAVMATCLLEQGAVLYVRTNVPQSLMFGETINNVFGTTTNPANRNLSPGGSSGGEGALIAMRGSVLGVGTDIGGSIRIPATSCGLYGLRPSYNRMPYAGCTNSMEGQESIPSVIGPLSLSLDGLKIFFQAVLASKPWTRDPLCLRMPWQEDEYQLASHGGPKGEELCFAMLWNDGVCTPDPPYKRALEMTKTALEKAGHKVIDWTPYKTAEGFEILGTLYNADGGHDIDAACALSGEPRIMTILEGNKHLPTWDAWQLARRKQIYIRHHLEHWEATVSQTGTGRPVDAIIAPGGGHCPPPHMKSSYVYYTAWSNLTDQVASVIPVTSVDPALDVKPHRSAPFLSKADEDVYNLYDAEYYKDAPIGIQVVGRKNEEEAVLRMTEIVDAALRASK